MYYAFYGLDRPPFNLTPDPRFLFLSRRHEEALVSLEYGVASRKGFTVLTGEVGAGKTTLCRTLVRRLGDHTRVALILNSALSDLELLQAINDEYGVHSASSSKKELLDALNGFLLTQNAAGHDCLLIIDEAQNLSPATLEQVRLLSNLETETDKLIQILLMGQPELRDTLRLPQLEQLNQRITVRHHLGPLDREDVEAYVLHRLGVAAAEGSGAHHVAFSPGAFDRIHRFSGGVPRKVNLVVDRALLAGYAAEARTITESLVEQAVREVAGDDSPSAGVSASAVPPAPSPFAAQMAPPPPGVFTPWPYPVAVAGAPGWTASPYGPVPMPAGAYPGPPPAAWGAAEPPRGASSPPPAAARRPRPRWARALGTALLVALACAAVAAAVFLPRQSVFARLGGAAGARSVSDARPDVPLRGEAAEPRPTAAPAAAPAAVATPPASPAPPPRHAPFAPWTRDADGVVRVLRPEHTFLAAQLTILSTWCSGVSLDIPGFARHPEALLQRLALPDIPALRRRGLVLEETRAPLNVLLQLGYPAVLKLAVPEGGTISPYVVLPPSPAPPAPGDPIPIWDPRHGSLRVPRERLEPTLEGALLLAFDPAGHTRLATGDEGHAVLSLQHALADAGAWPADAQAPTGRVDDATAAALIAFQRQAGLPASGRFDLPTLLRLAPSGAWLRMEDEEAPTEPEAPAPAAAEPPAVPASAYAPPAAGGADAVRAASLLPGADELRLPVYPAAIETAQPDVPRLEEPVEEEDVPRIVLTLPASEPPPDAPPPPGEAAP